MTDWVQPRNDKDKEVTVGSMTPVVSLHEFKPLDLHCTECTIQFTSGMLPEFEFRSLLV